MSTILSGTSLPWLCVHGCHKGRYVSRCMCTSIQEVHWKITTNYLSSKVYFDPRIFFLGVHDSAKARSYSILIIQLGKVAPRIVPAIVLELVINYVHKSIKYTQIALEFLFSKQIDQHFLAVFISGERCIRSKYVGLHKIMDFLSCRQNHHLTMLASYTSCNFLFWDAHLLSVAPIVTLVSHHSF